MHLTLNPSQFHTSVLYPETGLGIGPCRETDGASAGLQDENGDANLPVPELHVAELQGNEHDLLVLEMPNNC